MLCTPGKPYRVFAHWDWPASWSLVCCFAWCSPSTSTHDNVTWVLGWLWVRQRSFNVVLLVNEILTRSFNVDLPSVSRKTKNNNKITTKPKQHGPLVSKYLSLWRIPKGLGHITQGEWSVQTTLQSFWHLRRPYEILSIKADNQMVRASKSYAKCEAVSCF